MLKESPVNKRNIVCGWRAGFKIPASNADIRKNFPAEKYAGFIPNLSHGVQVLKRKWLFLLALAYCPKCPTVSKNFLGTASEVQELSKTDPAGGDKPTFVEKIILPFVAQIVNDFMRGTTY